MAILRANGITAIADVRSAPFSRFNPQFNKQEIKTSLASNGIRYVFLGAELGARSSDPSCYVDGKVQYERIAETPEFASGIARVMEGAKTHRVALMCAEKEPLDCHRTILVSRELVDRGIEVGHILADTSVEPHDQTVTRLLDTFGMSGHDMFRTREQILEDAYSRQASRIAYQESDSGSAPYAGEIGGIK
jgi:uncharacterized protein (DUF488 family)